MTDKVFVACMALLEAAFGAQEAARHRLYRDRFKDTDDADFRAAVMRCIDECRTFPSVRDILDRIPGRMTEADAAEAAWQRVLQSASSGPVAYHPATGTWPLGTDLDPEAFSAIGGQAGLRRIWDAEDDPEQMGFIRRDFLESYRAIRRMGTAGLLPTGQNASGSLGGPMARGPRLLRDAME